MNLESLGQASRRQPRDQKTNARVQRSKVRDQHNQQQPGTANQCCGGTCEVSWKPAVPPAVPRASSR